MALLFQYRNAMAMIMALLSIHCAMSKFTGWIDPATPADKRTTHSLHTGIKYDLVMSDEFETEGRTFDDGDDPTWTGINRPDDDQTSEGKKSLQYYNASQIRTKNGNLVITTSTEETHWKGWNPYKEKYEIMKRHFKSGMLQSWNKFCFTGGIMEVDVRFPGKHDVGGLWPAVWLLGNLGRAAFEASTNKLWPWSYDLCDRKLQHAQELSACDVTKHYSFHPHQGRGATEIDLIEVMPGPEGVLPFVSNDVGRPYSAMTLQLAPGIPARDNRPPSGTRPEWGFTWYENLTFGANTSINPFFYGTYLAATKKEEPIGRQQNEAYQCDAIGSLMGINESFWNKMHTFRLEWQPGREDGYIRWYVDNEIRFGIEQSSFKKYNTFIPEEPSYLIMNTAISTSWGFPAPPIGCTEYDCKTTDGRCGFNPGFCESLPAEFQFDHVRVYQNKKDPKMYLGCNPKSHPTKRFIAAHPERYMMPTDAKPLKPVRHGGGVCKTNADCGGSGGGSSSSGSHSRRSSSSHSASTVSSGTTTHNKHESTTTAEEEEHGICGVFYRCHCHPDYTGPYCLVPSYQNDFPDWDREDWAIFVAPELPYFLTVAVMMCVVVLLVTIIAVVNKRSSSSSNTY